MGFSMHNDANACPAEVRTIDKNLLHPSFTKLWVV
jgi:hypothetical protein